MSVILWEYQVKPERVTAFEKTYGDHGEWAELFKNHRGYLGTELLRDPSNPYHYMTIDRWASKRDYESFLSKEKKAYAALDAQCASFTGEEVLLGKWEPISDKTR